MAGFTEVLGRRRLRLGSYAALLLALVAYLIVHSMLHESGLNIRWGTGLLFLLIFFATIFPAADSRRQLASLIALAVASVVLDAALMRSDARWIEVSSYVVHVLFLLLTIGVILRHVFRDAAVSVDMILGAVCAYLLIGLAFNQVFSLLETMRPGSFAGSVAVQADGGYFSLVTLSTLGYGDMVPIRALARSIAALEAVTGQFYIAVIVAQLVAMRISHAPSRKAGEVKS